MRLRLTGARICEQSPARKIVEILSRPIASDARILVIGTIGAGKTTALLRVAEARADHEFVVFLDLSRWFDRIAIAIEPAPDASSQTKTDEGIRPPRM